MLTTYILITLLLTPLAIGSLLAWLKHNPALRRMGGIMGLSLLFLFLGTGNFVVTAARAVTVPMPTAPSIALVLMMGATAVALSGLILVPRFRKAAAWVTFALLAIALPLEILDALENNPAGGHLWGYIGDLPIRVAVAALIASWTYWFLLGSGINAINLHRKWKISS